jgi:alkyldihydroxyacetonephosphate synthase
MRLQDRPTFRAGASVRFDGPGGFLRGAEAVRRLAQSGLHPSNCRLLDAQEAQTSGAGDGSHAVLVLGFESADHPLDAWIGRALELCRDAGGLVPEGAGGTKRASGRKSAGGARSANDEDGPAGAWRRAFLQAPYVRDVLVACSVIAETFETAIPWNTFPAFHDSVMGATRDAVLRVCGAGTVACRFTHVYPDGAAPYYSVLAPAQPGSELAQWAEIKAAAMDAVIRGGGTVTHHHAVGRDHRPGYDRERPELFAAALRAAKRTLDPRGLLNPGVLIDV